MSSARENKEDIWDGMAKIVHTVYICLEDCRTSVNFHSCQMKMCHGLLLQLKKGKEIENIRNTEKRMNE